MARGHAQPGPRAGGAANPVRDGAPEALRAQAVAARTYILQRMRGGAANHPEAGVCDQYTCCCAHKDDAALREQWGADYARNMARIRQAVTDTDGQYLTYGGQLIRAVFHASSAGATESSAALWSGDAPYLVSVSSPETAQDVPNYVSTAEIAADAVRAAVLDSYPGCVLGDDPGTWFGTPELDDSGRVARIPVGSETLTGAQARALFSLRSAAFSVAYSGGMFTFTVTGSGHGVGMSQYGANVMAIRGSGYADILAHFVQIGFLVGQVVAIHNDCAAGDFFQAVQAAQKSRLAAAGGAEDDNDLALIDIRRYIAQDLEVAEVFFQMLNVNFDILLIDAHG